MKNISRRNFIGKGVVAAGAAWAWSALPESLLQASAFGDIPLGFQTYPIRETLSKDFAATLKMMADMGYKDMEMCSPSGYATGGFGPLVSMKTSDMRKTIKDSGLNCTSCHFGYGEITDKVDDRIAFAQELGLTDMVCSTFWLPETAKLKDYQDSADKLNEAARKIKKAGMQAGFHNHEMEFKMLEGRLIYDVLLERFDPDLVKMQFQTEVINLGFKGSTYFDKYPGRFISAHLSDWTADKKAVPIGKGIIDWKEFFASAKKCGVKKYYVEMEPSTFQDSATFLLNYRS